MEDGWQPDIPVINACPLTGFPIRETGEKPGTARCFITDKKLCWKGDTQLGGGGASISIKTLTAAAAPAVTAPVTVTATAVAVTAKEW